MLPSRQKVFFFFSEEVRRINRAPASPTATTFNPAWLTDPTNANYVDPACAIRLRSSCWRCGRRRTFSSTGAAHTSTRQPNVNNTRQEVVRVDYDWNPTPS